MDTLILALMLLSAPKTIDCPRPGVIEHRTVACETEYPVVWVWRSGKWEREFDIQSGIYATNAIYCAKTVDVCVSRRPPSLVPISLFPEGK